MTMMATKVMMMTMRGGQLTIMSHHRRNYEEETDHFVASKTMMLTTMINVGGFIDYDEESSLRMIMLFLDIKCSTYISCSP